MKITVFDRLQQPSHLLTAIGWEAPLCTVCGEPMTAISWEYTITAEEEITDARVVFTHCGPRAHGHAFSSPLYGGTPGECVLCHMQVGEFAPGPCPAVDPLMIDKITFMRDGGFDHFSIEWNRG